jgi:hypothetical protein
LKKKKGKKGKKEKKKEKGWSDECRPLCCLFASFFVVRSVACLLLFLFAWLLGLWGLNLDAKLCRQLVLPLSLLKRQSVKVHVAVVLLEGSRVAVARHEHKVQALAVGPSLEVLQPLAQHRREAAAGCAPEGEKKKKKKKK